MYVYLRKQNVTLHNEDLYDEVFVRTQLTTKSVKVLPQNKNKNF